MAKKYIYSSGALSTYVLLWNHYHHPPPELFFSPDWSSVGMKHTSPCPLPQPRAPTTLAKDVLRVVGFQLLSPDSLRPHGQQHASLPCLLPSPGACSNSCLLSQWCHPSNHLILCHPLLLPSVFPSIRVFSNKSVLRIRWPKYWNFSFSISPSNGYLRLISFRTDWFHLLAVQGTLKSPPTPQFKSINSSVQRFLYSSTLTSIHDHWKNHSLD